ncbi:MAG: PQQ-binding-like beta-propeller repeat protein [Candidatus Bathyarchaeia archaeon]|jgi:hypothetical protein
MSNIKRAIFKNKTGAIAIVALLIFSMSASTMLMPTAKAAAVTFPTHAYINVSPNPVGVGQREEVIIWLNILLPGTLTSNNIRFSNYTLTITPPNGTVISYTWTVVPDPTSAADYYFTPTQAGTYTLNFTFAGMKYNFPPTMTMFGPNYAYIGDYYAPSSASTTLTVQQSPISNYPTTPLPTMYWTRPIYAYNTNWYTVSSNWLGDLAPGYTGFTGTYNAGGNGEQLAGAGDVVGSLTSHVMWTKPLDSGGVVGGNQTAIVGDTYFEGSAYNQRYTNPIIVDGVLVYTEPVSFAGVPGSLSGSAYGPTVGVNLQTGQQLWSDPGIPAISFAYVYDVQDPNQHGVYPPILFSVSSGAGGETWKAYDAFTGDYMFTTKGIPTGSTYTTMLGPEGEYLIISLVNYGNTTNPNWYLQEWNSSRLWGANYNGASTSPPVIPPVSNEGGYNLTGGWTGGYVGPSYAPTYVPSMYDYNVSVPYLNALPSPITLVGGIYGNILLCYSGTLPSIGNALFFGGLSDTPYTYVGININEQSGLGAEVWHNQVTPPADNITVLEAGIDPVNRVFVENYRETNNFVGYSLETGAKLWGPTAPQGNLDYYGSPASGSLANAFGYGKMYSSAYTGIVYCYDTLTGNLLWTYGNGGSGNSTNSGLETPFANYPTFVNAIGSGAVYIVTTEHTPESPLFKGGFSRAINATTGKQIWTISDYTGEFETFSYAAADGYNTWFNGYDAQIYTVGRGPTATTVTAPNIGVTTATPITITGTVMDISAGTKQNEQAADFPNGVPVASDASMAAWMGYVYQQQPEPLNFTGVPVQIAVLDSNGNHYSVGTATTDEYGTYSLTWTPSISGNFTVYATFAGTNGYWPSSADTHLFASSKAAPTTAPTATPTSVADLYFVPAIAGLFVLIIVVAIVLALLMLRKRA